jgi:hypothetical protein
LVYYQSFECYHLFSFKRNEFYGHRKVLELYNKVNRAIVSGNTSGLIMFVFGRPAITAYFIATSFALAAF